MPNFANKNLAELRQMSKKQILDLVTANIASGPQTKRELIAWLLDTDILHDAPREKHGPHGQTEYVQVSRDVETDAVLKTVKTEWTYYEPSGCVKDIVTTETDGAGKVATKRTVHHFEDGRQPTVTTG